MKTAAVKEEEEDAAATRKTGKTAMAIAFATGAAFLWRQWHRLPVDTHICPSPKPRATTRC